MLEGSISSFAKLVLMCSLQFTNSVATDSIESFAEGENQL
jgi:hypothetical protein